MKKIKGKRPYPGFKLWLSMLSSDFMVMENLLIPEYATESVNALSFHRGKKIWVSFKTSAVKYIEQ